MDGDSAIKTRQTACKNRKYLRRLTDHGKSPRSQLKADGFGSAGRRATPLFARKDGSTLVPPNLSPDSASHVSLPHKLSTWVDCHYKQQPRITFFRCSFEY